MKPIIAIYAGSFDPLTNGHLEIILRSTKIFDQVIVAVGRHPSKPGFFSAMERVELIRASTPDIVAVESFDGLLFEYAAEKRASVLIRGLRAHGDFEMEYQLAMANKDMAPNLETMFMLPSMGLQFVSSSLVREIAFHGGDFERYVPAPVAEALRQKIGRKP